MFGFGRKTRELQAEICRLKDSLADQTRYKKKAYEETVELKKVVDGHMETIKAMRGRITEIVNERDALSESVDQLHNSCRELQAENTQLRDGAGHALHALAAVQDVANAFVKRLDMLPPMCGLPQDLVNEVFQDFDKDLQARREYAKKLQRESFTIQTYADDKGTLRISPDDNTVRYLTLNEVQVAVHQAHGPFPYTIQWPEDEIRKVHELGLFKFPLGLGKNVIANINFWVIPSTIIPEPNSEEIHK